MKKQKTFIHPIKHDVVGFCQLARRGDLSNQGFRPDIFWNFFLENVLEIFIGTYFDF
jgi:hypothetical protein